jgi:maltoporin
LLIVLPRLIVTAMIELLATFKSCSLVQLSLQRLLILISALYLSTLPPSVHAQTPQELQSELQQIKQLYEQKIATLENRISMLEQQNAAVAAATQENTVSVNDMKKETAAQQSPADQLTRDERTQIAQEQVASTPRYAFVRDAEQKIAKLQEQAKAFEFHGYLRSGYGLNSEGGRMVAFQAPGAGAKYRLGNETDTYGELTFVNNWINSKRDTDKTWMKTNVTVQADTTQSSTFASNDHFRLREAFVQIGNVFQGQPEAKFWAGERYYRRLDIHINDFYMLDTSGYGGGVEDLNVGFGKASLSYLAGARDDITTDNGTYAKSVVDARVYDIKAPLGKIGFWFDYSHSKGGTTSTGTIVPSVGGWAVGFAHSRTEWLGGYNRLTIQYAVGAAANFSTGIEDPTPFNENAHTFRFTESTVLQPAKYFAIQPAFVYQQQSSGVPGDGTNKWVSFGARPVFFFNDHLSLALEPGFDKTKSGAGLYKGWVRKFTIAPQIGAGREFFSRPVLRAFATYASWSDELKGLVGGQTYQSKTSGWNFGLQAETWW